MFKRIIIPFILLAICCCSINEQTLNSLDTLTNQKRQNIFRRVDQDASLLGQSVVKSYLRPFKWKKKEWLLLGGTLVTAGAASLLDRPIYRFTQSNQTSFQDGIASFGDFMGQPKNNYPMMLGFWSAGVIVNNEWMRDTGVMLIASVTASGLIQTFAKTAVGRSRSTRGEEFSYNFRSFADVADSHSFPSGHSMLALSMYWILARQTNFVPLKVVFYAVPVVVGWSRVYDNAHWFSDIILGVAFGEAVLQIYPKLKKGKNETGLRLSPTSSGFGLVYKW